MKERKGEREKERKKETTRSRKVAEELKVGQFFLIASSELSFLSVKVIFVES